MRRFNSNSLQPENLAGNDAHKRKRQRVDSNAQESYQAAPENVSEAQRSSVTEQEKIDNQQYLLNLYRQQRASQNYANWNEWLATHPQQQIQGGPILFQNPFRELIQPQQEENVPNAANQGTSRREPADSASTFDVAEALLDDEDDKQDDKKSGRRKIKIEYITDRSRRHITFSKRKFGIMKKAFELHTLTGTQVLLLVASETGHVYSYATDKLEPIIKSPEGQKMIQACLNSPDPEDDENGNSEDNRGNANGPDVTPPSFNQPFNSSLNNSPSISSQLQALQDYACQVGGLNSVGHGFTLSNENNSQNIENVKPSGNVNSGFCWDHSSETLHTITASDLKNISSDPLTGTSQTIHKDKRTFYQ